MTNIFTGQRQNTENDYKKRVKVKLHITSPHGDLGIDKNKYIMFKIIEKLKMLYTMKD